MLPLFDMLMKAQAANGDAMTAMAKLMGADPAFVAAHHVIRLLFLAVFVPVLLARQGQPAGD